MSFRIWRCCCIDAEKQTPMKFSLFLTYYLLAFKKRYSPFISLCNHISSPRHFQSLGATVTPQFQHKNIIIFIQFSVHLNISNYYMCKIYKLLINMRVRIWKRHLKCRKLGWHQRAHKKGENHEKHTINHHYIAIRLQKK